MSDKLLFRSSRKYSIDWRRWVRIGKVCDVVLIFLVEVTSALNKKTISESLSKVQIDWERSRWTTNDNRCWWYWRKENSFSRRTSQLSTLWAQTSSWLENFDGLNSWKWSTSSRKVNWRRIESIEDRSIVVQSQMKLKWHIERVSLERFEYSLSSRVSLVQDEHLSVTQSQEENTTRQWKATEKHPRHSFEQFTDLVDHAENQETPKKATPIDVQTAGTMTRTSCYLVKDWIQTASDCFFLLYRHGSNWPVENGLSIEDYWWHIDRDLGDTFLFSVP